MLNDALRIGLLINPYAGIGGPMALKGSDDVDVSSLLSKGGKCLSNDRALVALQMLQDNRSNIQWFTAPAQMGADILQQCGFDFQVVGKLSSDFSTAEDSERICAQLVETGIDLLLFVGGDGTACNIVNSLKSHDYHQQLSLGIPAGVKMHSGVYTVSPQAAARILLSFIQREPVSTGLQEVRDIDEVALREGKLNSRYFGELLVPNDQRYIQQVKNTGRQNEEEVQADIAASIVDNMHNDTVYIVGCGTTPQAIMTELGLPNTLLGIDVLLGKILIAVDVTASELMAILNQYPYHHKMLLITAIGGQGHIIGRGNQQITAAALTEIGKQNTTVLVTPSKLSELEKRPLLIDSGDASLDHQWSGWITVHTGYQQTAVYPLGTGE